jgi:hypothetical protein
LQGLIASAGVQTSKSPRNDALAEDGLMDHTNTASRLHHGSDIGTIGPRGVNRIPVPQL